MRRYRVQFTDLRYPEYYIEADSLDEARAKAELIDPRTTPADWVEFTDTEIFDIIWEEEEGEEEK